MIAQRKERLWRRLQRAVEAYVLRHAQTLVGSLGRLARQPVSTGMTVAVIGIALALPAALHLLVVNGRVLGGSWESVADVSVYLTEVSDTRRDALATEFRERADVAAVRVITAEDAFTEFRDLSGFGASLDGLETNPLPDTLIVRPAAGHEDAAGVAALAEALAALPETDLVQIDTDWVQRFQAILSLLRRAVIVGGTLLALAVMLIIGNTIRLDIHNRRQEIEVTKLVGASDGFVRRPFLYSGFWYGLAGGLVALVLTHVTLALLRGPVTRLAGLYGSEFRLIGLNLGEAATMVAGGALLGWLGSAIAATRHLRQIEP